jgi:hypothetical protein
VLELQLERSQQLPLAGGFPARPHGYVTHDEITVVSGDIHHPQPPDQIEEQKMIETSATTNRTDFTISERKEGSCPTRPMSGSMCTRNAKIS